MEFVCLPQNVCAGNTFIFIFRLAMHAVCSVHFLFDFFMVFAQNKFHFLCECSL